MTEKSLAATAAKPAPLGLRERNKLDKRERILATASRLFAEKGYSAVTTSSIAKEAHVGNGTLFRYARTKADLLVAVMNELMLGGIRNGIAHAHDTGDPVTSILTLLQPLSDEGLNFPENIIAYEKEALFGDKTHQDLVTTRIADVEQAILQILKITKTHPREATASQEDLARAIYATIYMDLIKASVGHDDVATLPARIPETIRRLIRAFCEG
ncbi:MAG: TetR/AcrR family transcriptional regulator [Bifidobacteriaceae bacterium]|jgi:AcrR family transcriptional regulator|nr:TetR/AcrR family transcriptional regulator [Bifidobacteriaceae bacterium]